MGKLRMGIACIAGAASMAVLPAAAPAQSKHRHHSAKKHGHKHHAKAKAQRHVLHIGAAAPQSGVRGVSAAGNAAATTTPTTTPTAPATGAPAAPKGSATVLSFTGGVLTLKLTDGSQVAGTVTGETEIACIPAAGATPTGEPGEDESNEPDESASPSAPHPGDSADGSAAPKDDDATESASAHCTSSVLVVGAVIHSADLQIGSAGAEFRRILVQQ